ncbi:transcription termination/antitermination protein NusG [Thermanaerothrix daxensis]|uniref:transcription termination/antitermination protein NusG n=1 Tax=Thermanaerothrix daxensis TaxID=869279 RepID=UPI0006C9352D|nr:transcription termination/antitermination NusG family protein [Thermanaerothrix daxensis]
MPPHWYAVHSHPHREESLARYMEESGLEVFYPHLRVSPVNPRSRRIRAYFPGYVFVRADLEQTGHSLFQWMPFATGLVSFGGEPAIVPDSLILSLKAHLERLNRAEAHAPAEPFRKGEEVQIETGPFAGYEAIFDAHLPGRERVRVLLKFLGERRVPLELDPHQLRKPTQSS